MVAKARKRDLQTVVWNSIASWRMRMAPKNVKLNIFVTCLIAFIAASVSLHNRFFTQTQPPSSASPGSTSTGTQKTSGRDLLLIFLISFFHFAALFATLAWAFIFPAGMDIVLIVYTLLRMASYVFVPGGNGECLINYAEKRVIDPSYRLGSTPSDEPYVNGLPRVLQTAIGISLLTLAPTMIFLALATWPMHASKWPGTRLTVALLVTLYAIHGFVGFVVPKLSL